MFDYSLYHNVSPCDYADALPRSQFVHYSIKPLHANMTRVCGPAFTVRCEKGDHLMLHAAIYRAKPGDVIIVQADDEFALAGGNVCAIAQKRGVAAFVIDGVIRDLAEVRKMGFPVFAKGVIPKPGKKACISPLQQVITCGGVSVSPGDIVVGDEEGIAVIPKQDAPEVLRIAQERVNKEANMNLQEWEAAHVKTVESKLTSLGFTQNLS